MPRSFFDHEPTNWQELEQLIQQAFEEMGYESNRNYPLVTVRGTARIDVHAVRTSSPIPAIVLCECKYWDKPVDQNAILSFRTICQDAGAHYGLIISRRGFQVGAEASRSYTNVHLMNFAEFQDTFFDEWKHGALTMLTRMRDQLLPIQRAIEGNQKYGLDLVDELAIQGIDYFNKFAILMGWDHKYSDYFIEDKGFPAAIIDPRGDPLQIARVTVNSHREYLEIARQAVVENIARFNLPPIYFTPEGKLVPLKDALDRMKLYSPPTPTWPQ
jgi:hypothetical protein